MICSINRHLLCYFSEIIIIINDAIISNVTDSTNCVTCVMIGSLQMR